MLQPMQFKKDPREVGMYQQLLETRIDAAKTLGISLRKLELLIDAKQIKICRIGKRVLIPRRALEVFIRRNTE
jgi:excisionase family DNA binding protein